MPRLSYTLLAYCIAHIWGTLFSPFLHPHSPSQCAHLGHTVFTFLTHTPPITMHTPEVHLPRPFSHPHSLLHCTHLSRTCHAELLGWRLNANWGLAKTVLHDVCSSLAYLIMCHCCVWCTCPRFGKACGNTAEKHMSFASPFVLRPSLQECSLR